MCVLLLRGVGALFFSETLRRIVGSVASVWSVASGQAAAAASFVIVLLLFAFAFASLVVGGRESRSEGGKKNENGTKMAGRAEYYYIQHKHTPYLYLGTIHQLLTFDIRDMFMFNKPQ